MSGVAKGVKKVFKKVGKFVKKIIKPVAIAAAVYFTGGLALSAFPATASFAASMPGFAGGGILGTGVGAGSVAGTGLFSKGAAALGLGGGLASGAAAAGTSAAQLAGVYGTSTALAAAAPNAAALAAAPTSSLVSGAAATGVAGKAAATFGKMSLTDKLLLTKMGTDVAGALFGPTPQEEFESQAIEAAKFRGAFYGMEADGTGALPPPAQASSPPVVGSQSAGTQAPQATPIPSPMTGSVTPDEQQLLAGRDIRQNSFPRAGEANTVGVQTGPGEMHGQLDVPEGIFAPAPNVRYV